MTPVHLFALASQHAHWASVRQSVVTGNIANASTPGYTALDVEPFSAVMRDTAATMAKTSGAHFDSGPSGSASANQPSWEVENSGQPVAIDKELIKSGQAARGHALDMTIVGSFHRMLMASVRPGA